VAVALVLASGACSGSQDSDIPGASHPVTEGARTASPSSAPAVGTQRESPKPVPVFSQNGKARTLHYGNVEVDAAPEDHGVFTTVTVHNDTDEPVNYDIEVSIGNGVDWIASNTFRIYGIPPGGVKSQASSVGGTNMGPIPQNPKIYIDRLETY
jgi:hypothetical protein